MHIVTGSESLRYIDQALCKFRNDGHNTSRDGARSRIDDTLVPSNQSSLRGWSSPESLDYAPEPVEESIGRNRLTDSRQDALEEVLPLRRRSSSSSNWSILSNMTTLSQLEHRAHEKSQFAKLLPRSSGKTLVPQVVQKHNILSTLHGSLQRRNPMSRRTGSTGIACVGNEVRRETKALDDKQNETISKAPVVPDCRVSFEKHANHEQCNGHVEDLQGNCPPKRVIPQGDQLAEAQLALQETIITSIHDQAIRNQQVSKEKGKAKDRNGRMDDEENPEEIDRKLEITRELTKQVQICLNDESYKDLYLLDEKGTEKSEGEKYATLSDLVLMVRRTFRNLLVSLERPYRPTGVAVTDQELLEDFDVQLLVRKTLLRRYPSKSIEVILDTLDGAGSEADFRTLAAL